MQTILVIATGFTVVFLLTRVKIFVTLAALIGIVGLASDYAANKIARAWEKLGEGLGWVTSKILLAAVFFIFLAPIATLAKLLSKKDPLQLKKSADSTYYVKRDHEYVKADLENIW